MKVFRLNENANIPELIEGSACFEIKACLDFGSRVRFFNPLNKETYTPVKNINGKVGVQVYPQQRMMIPTGLRFDVPKNSVLKIYSLHDTVFKKGVNLANGVEIVNFNYDGELYVLIQNLSDAVAVIENSESIAQGILEKIAAYDLKEANTQTQTHKENQNDE